jgi:DNA-binding helix-hairpin-helix protein with protein kinase domain
MGPLPAIIDTNGHRIAVDRKLASGGEGTVFTLPNAPDRVAKIYHRAPPAQTADKLAAMVRLANPQLLSLAAWPTDLLFNSGTRQLVGFVMPRLKDCQPIQQLYNPVQRLTSFERSGWDFQVRAALNLAAAFDEVHKAGCLIGDVNQSNAQVSTKALVHLIDCDSFQVQVNGKQYLTEVGVAHYTPPELQGKSLRGLVRTQNHDRFGLAVLIYQLLFVGRHPYQGLYQGAGDPSFEQLIAEFRFAQGPMAHSWKMAPPPHTPVFTDIPAELGNLFRRAFERGSEANNRPAPAHWLSGLRRLEQMIVACSLDSGHKYWRGAGSCVWCRLAKNGGPEYYFAVDGGVGLFAVDKGKLQEMIRRLNACGPFDFPYDRRKFAPSHRPDIEPLPEGLEDHRTMSAALSVALILCVLAIPCGLFHWAISVFGAVGATVFGIWLAVHVCLSPWHRERRLRQKGRKRAAGDLNRLEERWHQEVQRYQREHSQYAKRTNVLIGECRGLTLNYQEEIQRVAANAEENARLRHLRLHLIADADIPKIGAGRKQTLAAHGIFAAADIYEERIRTIKGFGDTLTNSLLAWKNDVLRQFRFNPATAVSPAEHRPIILKCRTKQQQIFADLERNVGKLESLAPTCQAELQRQVPALKRAVGAYYQADANLRLLTVSLKQRHSNGD